MEDGGNRIDRDAEDDSQRIAAWERGRPGRRLSRLITAGETPALSGLLLSLFLSLSRLQAGNLGIYVRERAFEQDKVLLLVSQFHFSCDPASLQQQPLFSFLALDV